MRKKVINRKVPRCVQLQFPGYTIPGGSGGGRPTDERPGEGRASTTGPLGDGAREECATSSPLCSEPELSTHGSLGARAAL